jgi:hypothetical protein
MAVQTFRFECLMSDGKIQTVDARETAHPVMVIHKGIEGTSKRGKWILTHGPTSAIFAAFATLKECHAMVAELVARDPSGEVLHFCDPAPADGKDVFPSKWIPIEAWDLMIAAREARGLPVGEHPLQRQLGPMERVLH